MVVKAKVMEITFMLREVTRIHQEATTFDVIQLKNDKHPCEIEVLLSKFSCEETHISCNHLLLSWQIFQKWGVFRRSKGHGHEKFSRLQAPGSPFSLPCLQLVSIPPHYGFRSDVPD